jgi:hypothetical protein
MNHALKIASLVAVMSLTAGSASAMEDLWKDDPGSFRCLPMGPRGNLLPFLMHKIIQTPTVGRWEGDTLVVERPWTIKFKADFVPDTEMLEYVCEKRKTPSTSSARLPTT